MAAALEPETPSTARSFEKYTKLIQDLEGDPRFEYECMQEIETVLTNTMQDIPNLSKVPILVLTFSTYNATPRKDLLLGEVGLSVFTVEGGVVENFAALIDPGKGFPESVSESVKESASRLALPYPGYELRARDYRAVLDRIFQIGRLYSAFYDGTVTFHCLQKDWLITEMCLKWLIFRAAIPDFDIDTKYFFTVAPLEVIIPLMTTWPMAPEDDYEDCDSPFENELRGALAEMKIETRGYTPTIPSSVGGKEVVFQEGFEVTEYLAEMNYANFPELGCSYHFERHGGESTCALNLANRHAFSLLYLLVEAFRDPPRLGAHYPTLRNTLVSRDERARRLTMLRKWEIFSPVELATRERTQEEDAKDAARCLARATPHGVSYGGSRSRGTFLGRGRAILTLGAESPGGGDSDDDIIWMTSPPSPPMRQRERPLRWGERQPEKKREEASWSDDEYEY